MSSVPVEIYRRQNASGSLYVFFYKGKCWEPAYCILSEDL